MRSEGLGEQRLWRTTRATWRGNAQGLSVLSLQPQTCLQGRWRDCLFNTASSVTAKSGTYSQRAC